MAGILNQHERLARIEQNQALTLHALTLIMKELQIVSTTDTTLASAVRDLTTNVGTLSTSLASEGAAITAQQTAVLAAVNTLKTTQLNPDQQAAVDAIETAAQQIKASTDSIATGTSSITESTQQLTAALGTQVAATPTTVGSNGQTSDGTAPVSTGTTGDGTAAHPGTDTASVSSNPTPTA